MAGGSYQTVSTVSLGEMNPSLATWNNGTALNTAVAVLSADFSANTLIVTLQQTTTITGGQITFQYSTDGVNWTNVTGVIPGTQTLIGPTYNFVANTYALFEFNVTGFSYFQVVLSAVITGTGSVTIGYSGDSFVGDTISLSAPVSIAGTVPVKPDGTVWTLTGTSANVNVTNTVTVSGTVTANQGGAPWSQNLTQVAGVALGATAVTNFGTAPAATAVPGVNASIYAGTTGLTATGSSLNANVTNTVTVTGTVSATQGTTPWTIQGDSASGAAKAGNPVQIGGVFNTTQPTVTTGQTVEAQMTARGAQIVAVGVDGFAVTGTVTANQGGAPWSQNLTQVAGVALGATAVTNFGTAPAAAAVPGVNSSIFAGTTALTATGSSLNANVTNTVTVSGTITANQGTSPWVTNVTQWASTVLGTPQTFGTAPTGVVIGTSSDLYIAGTRARSNQTTTAAGVLDSNLVGIDGTTAVTAAAGVLKVGVVGNAGAAFDAVVGAGAAAPNMVQVGAVYNTTEPAPTNTQSVALQLDQSANLFTMPGNQFKTGAVWNSGTAAATVQYPTGTTTQGQTMGNAGVMVQLDQSNGTFTAGAVTFQGTYDNINWVRIPPAQIYNPQTQLLLSNPYTFVTNTNQIFQITLQGYVGIRINLSTAITGTGTVTPYWNVLPETSANITSGQSAPYDFLTGRHLRISPRNVANVAELKHLAGPAFNNDTTVDTQFWTFTNTGAGSAAGISGGFATLTSGTANSGNGTLTSVRKARFLPTNSNAYHGVVLVSNLASANSTCVWGAMTWATAPTVQDGFYFSYAGSTSTLSINSANAGTITTVSSGSFNGQSQTYTLDSNAHKYEIIYTPTATYFIIDNVLIHKLIPTSTPLASTFSVNVSAAAFNSAAGTASVSMQVWENSIFRMGSADAEPKFVNVTSNSTTVGKRGAGRLHRVVINETGGTTNTVTLYDNTAGSGTIIATINYNSSSVGTSLEYGVDFFTGLTIVVATGTAGNITVVYD